MKLRLHNSKEKTMTLNPPTRPLLTFNRSSTHEFTSKSFLSTQLPNSQKTEDIQISIPIVTETNIIETPIPEIREYKDKSQKKTQNNHKTQIVLKKDLLKKVALRNEFTKKPLFSINDIKQLLKWRYKKSSNIHYQAPLLKTFKTGNTLTYTRSNMTLTTNDDTFSNDLSKLRRGSDGAALHYRTKFHNTVIIKNPLKKLNSISTHFLPNIRNNNEEQRQKIMEVATKKTKKLLTSIENMIGGEYEDPGQELNSISFKNLSRVIELKKLQKGYNEEENFEKKNKNDKEQINEESQVKLAVYKCGLPSFLKTSFKNSTIQRYKDIKGIYFGVGRNNKMLD